MTYLILALLVISLLSVLVAVLSRKKVRNLKDEVQGMKSKINFYEAEELRYKKIQAIEKEISEEIHEIKKPLHSGSNADRFNASLNVLQNLTAGNDPDPDDPA